MFTAFRFARIYLLVRFPGVGRDCDILTGMNKPPRNRLFLIGLLLLHPNAETLAAGGELKVLSAIGMQQVILDLGPKFERATGLKLDVTFHSGASILKRVERGEKADVLLIPRSALDRLAETGKLVAGAPTDLAASVVGVAVRKGSAKPDIASPEAFKRAMLAAKTIACTSPETGGSSALHVAKVFERLGIANSVKLKLVLSGGGSGQTGPPGESVATGKAEIAVHQMQELLVVPGIEIVGPLPGALQETFLFSAAVVAGSKDLAGAKALIEFLATPAAKAVIKAKGMEPAAQ